jgi:hypothetical protein
MVEGKESRCEMTIDKSCTEAREIRRALKDAIENGVLMDRDEEAKRLVPLYLKAMKDLPPLGKPKQKGYAK